jgi:hypothetical protein
MVSCTCELLCARKTGRSRSNDRYGLAAVVLWHYGSYEPLLECLLNDGFLDEFDRDRIVADAEYTRCFTRSGTEPSRELREVVRSMEPIDSFLEIVAEDEIVPLRNEVAEGTAVVTEWNPAVHAACDLLVDDCVVEWLVDLLPVENS